MPLVNKAISNLINGVSQQPETLRLPSQCEAQINGFSSVVEGLKKRPPLNYVAKISPDTTSSIFIHTINRDVNERYVVTASAGNITVHDIDGTAKTVNSPNGFGYLNGSAPATDIRAVTVADYTFIVNKTKVPAKGSTSSGATAFEALYSVKQGVPSTLYSLTVAGTTYSYTTTDVASTYTTSNICTQIANAVSGAGYTVTNFGSTFHFTRSTDFTVLASDGYGDQASQVVKDTVQNFIDLPAKSKNGHVLEVTNSAENSFDNYYVKFVSTNNNDEGVWKETVAPNTIIDFDASTLPHQLVRNANGTFTFEQVSWGNMVVGDSASSPDPSFIGAKINDIFFHRNRLGFLSDEAVIMSRAGDFFEFYPETVTTILDTDPIDINVSHTKVAILRFAIPFDEELLLFSDQSQFVVAGKGIITSQNVTANVVTEYESSLTVPPVGAGRNVYFAFNKGNYSGVREYFQSADTDVNEAEDITATVPKYLPSNLKKFATASNENILVALSSDETNDLYVYQYYYSNAEKLQSAWHKWTIGNATDNIILNIDFIDTTLFLVVRRSDGYYIMSMDVSPSPVDTGATYLTHIDSKLKESQVSMAYNSGTDKTTITLPYAIDNTMQMVTRFVSGSNITAGVVIPTFSQTNGGTAVVVSGNYLNSKFFIGEPYEFSYQFSTQFVKESESSSGGKSAIKEGRLQIRNFTVSFNDSGFFKTEVTPHRRNPSTNTFTGSVVGTSLMGTVNLETGNFKFPVQSTNENLKIILKNNSFLPSTFVNAEWEGFWHQRGRNI